MEITLKISESPTLSVRTLDAFAKLALAEGKTPEELLGEMIHEKIAPKAQLTLDLPADGEA